MTSGQPVRSAVQARLQFKIADRGEEFEAIHRLNYRTFVEGIPQHAANRERRLVDRFHAQNSYLICLAGSRLAGMLALRTQRPFSLDEKLPDLDDYLAAAGRIGEVRLLAVAPQWRGSSVLVGLFRLLEGECSARGIDVLIVSATTRQQRLYRHLGFEPFGPLVGSDRARFQPMRLGRETIYATVSRAAWRRERGTGVR